MQTILSIFSLLHLKFELYLDKFSQLAVDKGVQLYRAHILVKGEKRDLLGTKTEQGGWLKNLTFRVWQGGGDRTHLWEEDHKGHAQDRKCVKTGIVARDEESWERWLCRERRVVRKEVEKGRIKGPGIQPSSVSICLTSQRL